MASESLYRLTTRTLEGQPADLHKSGVKPEDAGLRKDIEAALTRP